MIKYRQGDVYLIPVDAPSNVKKAKNNVLALGESTGHAHKIEHGEVFVSSNGVLFVKSSEATELQHVDSSGTTWSPGRDLHKSYRIDPGWYQVGVERECDPFTDEEVGAVID